MKAIRGTLALGGLVGLVLAMYALWEGRVEPMVYGPEHPRPMHEGRPNVVLIIGCTLRRDQMTPYGAPNFTTPFLARLAKRGVVFEHAVDSAPWTRPATTAILTGHHAASIGMVEPGFKLNRRRLHGSVETLAERLSEAGYETIGLTANPNLNAVFGFDQGFDVYMEAQGLWSDHDIAKVPALQLAVEAHTLIDGRDDEDAPLFLQVLTIDTHEPIDAYPKRARHLSRDGVPPRIGAYRVELQRWDEGLEELWQGLRRRGYTETNTVLMVVNDHGEGLSWPPEHGVGHGNFLFPSAVDMPWVVYGAGVAQGHRVRGMASQVDVHPTVLGLTGGLGYHGPGHNWSPQIRGDADRTTRTYAFSDTYYQRANRAAVYTEQKLCVHDFFNIAEHLGRDRVIPKTACFDRTVDPGARTPQPDVDSAMVEALMAWRREQKAAYEAWPHHESVTRDDPVMKQLEQLGYVDE